MKAKWVLILGLTVVTASLINVKTGSSDQPLTVNESTKTKDGAPTRKTEEDSHVTVEVARQRAKVMHDLYASTLEVLHHRYFHGDRATVPARAMEDIFAEIEQQSKTEAHWISASMEPMSINHKPATDFEKRAAKEIAKGTEHLEIVEDGYYRRAGAIPLRNGCVGCHGGFFKPQSKQQEFAGLVISVPIQRDRSSSQEL